jgi:anaerobic magnesium-protoporphyrin IX monomethyl ester cyclase
MARLTLVRVNGRSGAHPFLEETNVSGVYPPLGVAYLAGAARAAGHPTSVIDAYANDLPELELLDAVARVQPDVVGLTCTTFDWPLVARLARELRRERPQLHIWIGGPQLSLYPDECMAEQAVDLAVVGEGDEAIVELLDRVDSGEELASVAGTIVRVGDELIRGPEREPIADLDTLSMPALDLLPLARYRSLDLPAAFASMVTSRGCPFRCRYCSQVYVGGRYRSHGATRVVDEMVRAQQVFGAREIVFFDETFTMDRDWVLSLCEDILGRGLVIPWNVRTRVDRLDGDVLGAMAEAGCCSVHVGIETGSDRVQGLMNKNLRLDGVSRALTAAREAGLETRGYFMLGYPGETVEEMEQTLQLSLDLPLDWASYTLTLALPGTGIYEDALANGTIPHDYWREYTLGRVTEHPGYFTDAGLDRGQLEALLKRAYRSFYLRPHLIRRKAATPRLWRELPAIARTLLETLT